MTPRHDPAAIRSAAEMLGGPSGIAKLLDIKSPTVYEWLSGERPVPVQFCARLEQFTDGAVTRADLRPNDWHLIWPEFKKAAA